MAAPCRLHRRPVCLELMNVECAIDRARRLLVLNPETATLTQILTSTRWMMMASTTTAAAAAVAMTTTTTKLSTTTAHWAEWPHRRRCFSPDWPVCSVLRPLLKPALAMPRRCVVLACRVVAPTHHHHQHCLLQQHRCLPFFVCCFLPGFFLALNAISTRASRGPLQYDNNNNLRAC